MKTLVAVCLLACTAASPQNLVPLEGSTKSPADRDAEILRYDFQMGDNGQFQYGFETSNDIVVDVAGENRQIGDAAGVVMRGSYSYTSPEGIEVTVQWEADEAGFRASGPQVPAVPEYVKQLLKTPPAVPQPAVRVSSSEDAAIASEELVVPAAPAVSIIPTIVVEDAPAEVEVPVSDPVYEIVEAEIEYAPASAPIEDAPAPVPVVDAPAKVEFEVQDPVFVEDEVEDAPAPAPVVDAPAEVDFPVFVEDEVEDAPASTQIEDAPAPAPVEDIPALFPVEDAPAPVPVEDPFVPAPAEIALPVDIDRISNPVPVEVAPASAAADDTPDSIQDAIAAAFREDASAIGARAPAIPSISDIADQVVPSSEFIVLDA